MPVSDSFSFRMGGRVHRSDSAMCLYRAVDPDALVTRHLMLTKDGSFAYIERVIGGNGVYAAEDWSPDRAMRFLMQHGEGDLVDEFPYIFRKRAVAPAAAKGKKSTASPKERPGEPFLFPLH